MNEAVEAARHTLAALANGRVTPRMLSRVRVRAYGGQLPLEHVAQVSVQPPRTLLVTPHESSILPAVERALSAADLGAVPSNDGRVIRLTVPPPTEDRRNELAKSAKHEAERGRVAVRNARRDRINALRRQQRDGDINERQLNSRTRDVQNDTDSHIAEIEAALAHALRELGVEPVGGRKRA